MPCSEAQAPTISVVVCAFDSARAQRLLEALSSVREQSLAPHQVIAVIDHNPTLGALVQGVPGVTVVENTHAPGLSGARNTGVEAATGDIVAFVDDDARAAPDWLARLADAYRDAGVVGAGGVVEADWEAPRPVWMPEEFDWVVGCSYRGQPARPAVVRNLIGCNMSFRREALRRTGGFTDRLGRVAGRPLGCEETELCIRLRREYPDRVLLYDPRAVVRHHVPRTRATWRYFLARCHAEGRSKAEVTRLAGTARGLASERRYAVRTLPAGLGAALWAALARRDPGQLARATAILVGLATTAVGYLAGGGTAHRPSPARRVGAPA